jgi:hypothetical protein
MNDMPGSNEPAAPKEAKKKPKTDETIIEIPPKEGTPRQVVIMECGAAISKGEMERFVQHFQQSTRRWELVVYPAMFAFIVLAGYGFFLIYSLTTDMTTMARSIDPQMSRHMDEFSGHMANMSNNIGQLTQQIAVMSNTMDQMSTKLNTLQPMLDRMTTMDQSMRVMTSTTDQMGQDMSNTNYDKFYIP